MKYVVLMYGDESVWEHADEDARMETIRRHYRFSEVVRDHPAMSIQGGEALETHEAATTVRHDADGGRVVTDGPFVETAEHLGGYYVVEAPDLDTLMTALDELPLYYALEVRPVDDSIPE